MEIDWALLDEILNEHPKGEVVKVVLVTLAADNQRMSTKLKWHEGVENQRRRERLERFACASLRAIMNEDIITGDAGIEKKHASMAFDYAEAMLAECDKRTVPQ